MIRQRQVLILSKFRLSGEALRSYLSKTEPNYQVLFRDCGEAGRLPQDFSPEVVVLDCDGCDPDCPGIIPVSQSLPSKFIVIARSPELSEQIEWLRAGIRGVIDEAESEPGNLKIAIRRVLDGEVWASRKLLSAAFASIMAPQARNGFVADLTRREKEIASLMQEGLKNSAIAARLQISEKTVKGHLTNVYRKLGVDNRTQAVVQLGRKKR